MFMKREQSTALTLEIERINLLYQQNVFGLIAMSANAAAFIYIAWPNVSHSLLLAWYLILQASFLVRVIATYLWNRKKSAILSFDDVERWHNFIKLTLFVSGLSWGFCAWISVGSPSTIQHIFAGLLAFGMSAGAVLSYTPSLWAMLAVILPASLAWSVRLLGSGNTDLVLLGILVAVFAGLAVKAAHKLNNFVLTFLRMIVSNRESEERLRMARDSSSAVSWDWYPEKGLFLCEGNLHLLFGMDASSHSDTLESFIGGIGIEDRDKFISEFSQARETGQMDSEVSLGWRDGSDHWVAMRGRASAFKDGRLTRMTGIFWDVTTKNVQDKLRRERDVFEAANKRQLVFLANVSHEIRTPLAAINGFAELMLDSSSHVKGVREPAQIILRNGKYLSSIVNDLLDLAKLETDQLYIQRASLFPLAEIKDSLSLIEDSARQKNLEVSICSKTPIPETIISDAVRFRQILINLLVNAVKYTEKGSIEVELSFEQNKERGGTLRILIKDTGIGMSEETKANLFQPFVRGTQHIHRVPGSGLGLALSRRLVRNLGGDLKLLASTVGHGSTFELNIETGDVRNVKFVWHEEREDQVISFQNFEKANPSPQLCGRKILLVEDEPDLREMMNAFLTRQGASIQMATNGEEAVSLASQQCFDTILMDIKMPVMDGYQATKLLRQRGYQQPIVALTAHANSDDRQRCYDAGCDNYLSKPVDMALLLKIMDGEPSGVPIRVKN